MTEQNRLTVAAPLFLQSMPGCTMLGIAGSLTVRPLILRGVETGGGFYKGDWQDGSPNVANGSNTLTLPFTGHRSSSNSSVLVFNPAENNKTGHALNPSTGSEIYVSGLAVGRTSENPSREVALLLGGGSGSSVSFASIDATWTSGNWVNAHLMSGTNTTTNALQLALTSPPQYNPPASTIGWCHLAANDVVAYQPLDKTVYLVDGLIISPNITAQGTAVAQVLQVTGLTPLKHGFDWVLSHP